MIPKIFFAPLNAMFAAWYAGIGCRPLGVVTMRRIPTVLAVACLLIGTPVLAQPVPGQDVPAAPEDGGPINWEVIGVGGGLHLRAQPSTSADILASYPSGPFSTIDGLITHPDGEIARDPDTGATRREQA